MKYGISTTPSSTLQPSAGRLLPVGQYPSPRAPIPRRFPSGCRVPLAPPHPGSRSLPPLCHHHPLAASCRWSRPFPFPSCRPPAPSSLSRPSHRPRPASPTLMSPPATHSVARAAPTASPPVAVRTPAPPHPRPQSILPLPPCANLFYPSPSPGAWTTM